MKATTSQLKGFSEQVNRFLLVWIERHHRGEYMPPVLDTYGQLLVEIGKAMSEVSKEYHERVTTNT